MFYYNLTQTFPVESGDTYTISANAEEAANGATAPTCFVQICADGTCGAQTALTSSYQLYSYSFVAGLETEAIAVLMFMCSGAAYVGVDNVAASAATSGTMASGAVSSPATPAAETAISYFTTTEVVTTTQELSQSVPAQGAFQSPPTITETVTAAPQSYAVVNNVTYNQYFTNTLYSTAVETTTAPGQNITNDHYATATIYSTAIRTETAPGNNITFTTTGKLRKPLASHVC